MFTRYILGTMGGLIHHVRYILGTMGGLIHHAEGTIGTMGGLIHRVGDYDYAQCISDH